jgi:aspartate/methionine/tyrosine aminotransferase
MNPPLDALKSAARISRRGESLGTENAFVVLAEVNELVRQGKDIVSFCIGQPDFPTPRNIQWRRRSLRSAGQARPYAVRGHRRIRAAAARDMASGGLAIAPEDVVVGAGAKRSLRTPSLRSPITA